MHNNEPFWQSLQGLPDYLCVSETLQMDLQSALYSLNTSEQLNGLYCTEYLFICANIALLSKHIDAAVESKTVWKK